MILPNPLPIAGLFVLCGLHLLWDSPACGQEPPAVAPEACVGLATDAERLACYDNAFHRDRLPGSADEPPPPPELMQRSPPRGDNTEVEPVASSLLDSRWELTSKAKLGTFGIRAYKPVYLLPAFYTDSPNQFPSSPAPEHTVATSEHQDKIETKFQISFKTKLAQEIFGRRGDLWFGYTQSSHWQVYNGALSRPFRETNYEPELMLVFDTRYRLFGLDGRLLGVSLDHQSNGKYNPYSRAWNRLIGMVGFERRAWTLVLRPWRRIADVAGEEDNPDIEDYVGRGDLLLVRRLRGHEISLMARHSLRGGRRSHGAAELGWVFPIHRDLKGYLQVFHGYGESLIDYNASSTRIGLGISLIEWY